MAQSVCVTFRYCLLDLGRPEVGNRRHAYDALRACKRLHFMWGRGPAYACAQRARAHERALRTQSPLCAALKRSSAAVPRSHAEVPRGVLIALANASSPRVAARQPVNSSDRTTRSPQWLRQGEVASARSALRGDRARSHAPRASVLNGQRHGLRAYPQCGASTDDSHDRERCERERRVRLRLRAHGLRSATVYRRVFSRRGAQLSANSPIL